VKQASESCHSFYESHLTSSKPYNEYTYDDVPSGQSDPNLNNFSISHDAAYIIPLLQQALQLNPNLNQPA